MAHKSSTNDAPVEGEVVQERDATETSVAVIEKQTVKKSLKKDKSEIVERDSAFSIVGNVGTKELRKALAVQTEQRNLIKEFINQHLSNNVDYGKIHINSWCDTEKKKKGSCTDQEHFSKGILFKPGQEKIFSLFSITDDLEKDLDAYDMLPDVKGLVAYKCTMYQKGKIVGHGRGAATLASERSDPNSTIKKAEKRARMDACLSLGFSEYFTQDLDDPEYASQREMMLSRASAEYDAKHKDEFGLLPREAGEPVDNAERQKLTQMLKEKGIAGWSPILQVLTANGIEDPGKMTSGQAREMMSKLANDQFVIVPVQAGEPTETPEGTESGSDDVPPPSAPAEPELVVDDDFKQAVLERIDELGLTSPGMTFLAKRSIGKLKMNYEQLNDAQWRLVYKVVEAIQSGAITLENHYVKGVMS